jgi:hypothetical protein
MFYKNILWLSMLLFLPPQKERWVINQTSNLTVDGTTNINKFNCDIPSYGQIDTLMVSKAAGDIMLTGIMALKVQSFNCHNKMMTADLRKTLKEKEYPLLYIRFLTLDGVGDLTSSPKFIKGLVNINLAGITKRFEVNYQVSVDADKIIHLLGSKDINFSDFNLIPPRKLGGMIRTNDQLTVSFHLKIKTI